jgi:membrane protease YdiL (CAAX protease family)
MTRAARLWLQLVVVGTGALALLLALSPERPGARLTPFVAVPLGAAAGLVLFLAVARRLPVRSCDRPLRLMIAVAVLFGLAAAAEEVLWRRVVLGELLRAGPAAALAASSLGFALSHRARPALHLGTGAVFGCVYLATGALAACIAAHWLYNLLLLGSPGPANAVRGVPP